MALARLHLLRMATCACLLVSLATLHLAADCRLRSSPGLKRSVRATTEEMVMERRMEE